jgi:hypothetical protein
VSSQEPPRPPAPPTQPTQALDPTAPAPRVVAPVATQPVVERLPPELPPEGPWWENPWPAIVTGVLCLIVGGLIGYAIGHKGESTAGERQAGRAVPEQTVTRTNTVVRPKVIVRTNTVTASTVTQTPAPANSANEERRTEAEADLRRVERENEELKRQLEESG